MGTYVNDGKVSLDSNYNYSEAVKEIASLIRVGTREDGRYYLADLCASQTINNDSLFRPYEVGEPTITNFKSGGPDGLYGYIIPKTNDNNVKSLWSKTWHSKELPTTWKILNMFDGYDHNASYDSNPFKIQFARAGSSLSVTYICDNSNSTQVNPGVMDYFKDYYPAIQIFEGDYNSANSTLVYSWCGKTSVSKGNTGDLISNIGLDDSKNYYIIPFLSQYKFTSTAGDMGTFSGNKYGIIYKDFKPSEWILGVIPQETSYSITFGDYSLNGSYGIRIPITISSIEKTFLASPFVAIRVWTVYNNVESIWYDDIGNEKYTQIFSSNYVTISPNSPVSTTIDLSFGGNSLPENVSRIEVKIRDLSVGSVWEHEYLI